MAPSTFNLLLRGTLTLEDSLTQRSREQPSTLQPFNLPLRGTLTLEDSLTQRSREQPSNLQPSTVWVSLKAISMPPYVCSGRHTGTLSMADNTSGTLRAAIQAIGMEL